LKQLAQLDLSSSEPPVADSQSESMRKSITRIMSWTVLWLPLMQGRWP